MSCGEKIAALRKEKGLTQADLGTELNVTFQAVSKWERGESYPDFTTVSRIAKFFGVPISYFEENGESVEEAKPEPPAPTDNSDNKKMMGVCKICGNVVYETEEGERWPELLCKKCHNKKVAQENKRRAQEYASIEAKKKTVRSRRNKGLIVAGIIIGIILALGIVGLVQNPTDIFDTVLGMIIVTVFGYTYIAQLFWGGLIVDVSLFMVKVIGAPGVIFTLDLDGLIFLVAVKILFAVLRFIVLAITILIGVFIAIIISPFVFVPQLLKMNRGIDLEKE